MGRRNFVTTMESKVINIVTKEPIARDSREVFGERIRYYRKKAGVLQPALAAQIGVSKNTVSNWEAGRARPDLDNIVQMCRVLNITPSQLFGSAGDLSTHERETISLYRSLNGANKEIIDSLMKQLLNAQRRAQLKRPNLTMLPREFRPLAAGIGDPGDYYEEGEMVYVHSDALHQHVDYIFTVNGDSMEPDYHSGDMVLVQIVTTADMTPGSIGAFQTENELYIKEYRTDGLYSHNASYAPMLFEDYDEICLIGEVVGILKKNDLATPEEVELYESFAADEV